MHHRCSSIAWTTIVIGVVAMSANAQSRQTTEMPTSASHGATVTRSDDGAALVLDLFKAWRDTAANVTSASGGTSACHLDLPACHSDIAGPNNSGPDGLTNTNDLLKVIETWGQNGQPNGPRPQGDCAPLPQGDCLVNVQDLLAVVNAWGACPPQTGACCLPSGQCLVNQTLLQCQSAGGTYLGHGSTCPGPCEGPANDNCLGAITLGNGSHAIDNTGATNSVGVPGGACIFGGPANISKDIWFKYTATCTGNVTVDLCATTGSVTDTTLQIYSGTCSNLAEVACDDDGCTGNPAGDRSRAIFATTRGAQYIIRVGVWGNSPPQHADGVQHQFDRQRADGVRHVFNARQRNSAIARHRLVSLRACCNGNPSNPRQRRVHRVDWLRAGGGHDRRALRGRGVCARQHRHHRRELQSSHQPRHDAHCWRQVRRVRSPNHIYWLALRQRSKRLLDSVAVAMMDDVRKKEVCDATDLCSFINDRDRAWLVNDRLLRAAAPGRRAAVHDSIARVRCRHRAAGRRTGRQRAGSARGHQHLRPERRAHQRTSAGRLRPASQRRLRRRCARSAGGDQLLGCVCSTAALWFARMER